MKGTMKAGVFYDVKTVKVEERPIPQITEDDILVKVRRAGICGSDTGAYLHGGLRYGIYKSMVFGHEFIGQVAEKGARVADDIQLGDLVFVDPTKARRGGLFLADVCGGFAEYCSVENAKQGYNVYKLKDGIDLDTAALIEPLSVGTQGALAMDPGPDDHTVVLGAGAIGLCAAAGLVNHGIRNVVVVDRNDWKLEIASALGAKTVNVRSEDMREKLLEYWGEYRKTFMDPRFVDPSLFQILAEMAGDATSHVTAKNPAVSLYVDCAGAKEMLLQSFSMAAENTKYSIVSVYDEPIAINGGLFMSQANIRGSAGYTHETILEVIDHLENNRTCIKKIITAKYRIDDFAQAIDDAANKARRNIKVLIDFD